MNKSDILEVLNRTDDYKALGFELMGDDGQNQLLVKTWGRGVVQLNRIETEDGVFYDDDVAGWNI